MTPRRVLVIEPDRLLRSLVAEWLEQAGLHAVFPANGPSQATADLGGIGAIVIDIPSPSHAEPVLRAWRRAFPKAAIVAASARFPACADDNDAMAGKLAVTKVLAKPYSRHELYTALGVPGQGGSMSCLD
jgi:DNA-binding response OmpR family regulator